MGNPSARSDSELWTVAEKHRKLTSHQLSGGESSRRVASYGSSAVHVRPLVWNTGVEWFINDTRLPGAATDAGTNLFYEDLEWNPLLLGPGEPDGVIPRLNDQQHNSNAFDGHGIILPWCSNTSEVLNKAIVVYRLADDLNTIEEPLLYMFQYYWDNVGYYLLAGFTSFDQKRSMGEGPSSMLDVTFFSDPSGAVTVQARTSD